VFVTAIILMVLEVLGSSQPIDAGSTQMLRVASMILLGFLIGLSITSVSRTRDIGGVVKRWEDVMSGLSGDERGLYEVVLRGGGAMLQSELNQALEMSKSKLSRVLARMEARGVLERRRSGMTNIVILK
jgi:uncharacterized membrane protein